MKAILEAHFVEQIGSEIFFQCDYETKLRIVVLDQHLIRISLLRKSGWELDRTWSISPEHAPCPSEGRSRDDHSGFALPGFTLVHKTNLAIIETKTLRLDISLSPLGLKWFEPGATMPYAQDRPSQAYLMSRKTSAIAHYMARDGLERHYGLGDKSGPLDRTGRRFLLDAVDPCGYDTETSDPLYKIIPFTIMNCQNGPSYGIFYDNLARGEVDYGCTLDNYHGLFRYYRADQGDLDYYFIAGPDMLQVAQRYSALTGGQAFAPRWSLGFGLTTMTIADAPNADARVSAFITERAKYDIPCDSFHFGSGYTSIGPRRYAFNWNRDKFPDPAATMQRLEAAGMRPVANIKPCLLDDHPRLDELKKGGLLVMDGETGQPAIAQFWDGLGFHMDFTNPDGAGWWRKGIKTALLDYGVVSAWNDNNEFEIWDEDAVVHGAGKPFAQSLNRPLQALLMSRISYETQLEKRPDERPYTISRAGGPGISRFAQTWTGDNYTSWKTLRGNLRQGLNMGLSGMSNIGHDVGGFHGPSPDPELFCRFVEFCSLWPRFVMNSWKDSGIVNLPWMHPEVLQEVKSAFALRYQLMPHLYTAMWQAAKYNMPVIRPLVMAFPMDARAATIDDCFLLGDNLLAAPVLDKGAVTRKLYLPEHKGGWYCFHSGQHFAGGTDIEVAAPLGHIPLFAAAGAMIAVSRQLAKVDRSGDDWRGLKVFAPQAGSTITTEIYDDNGLTPDWDKGAGRILRISCHFVEGVATFTTQAEGHYQPRYDRLRLLLEGFPADTAAVLGSAAPLLSL